MRRREKPEEVPYTPPELKGIERRIEQARELAGLKVEEVGTSRYERGYRLKNISAVVLVRLARKFGQPVGWLIAGEGEPRRPRPNDPAPIRAEEVEE